MSINMAIKTIKKRKNAVLKIISEKKRLPFGSLFLLCIYYTGMLAATSIRSQFLCCAMAFIKSSGFDSMTSIIKLNDFSDSFRNVTIYVASKDENNELKTVFNKLFTFITNCNGFTMFKSFTNKLTVFSSF